MGKVVVFNHPLMSQKLSIIRDERTCTKDFRQTINEIGTLMTYEITRDFETVDIEVKTPCGIAQCKQIKKDIVIVPILRAGLGMVDGVQVLVPTAKVGHVGLYRNEESLQPIEYYVKLPNCITDANVLVLDPMLATGGSAIHAIDALKKRNVKNISFVCIVAAPEGVKALSEAHPDVDIYLAALDEKLNEVGYIVPGLGDCGDRIFGTHSKTQNT